MKQGWEIKKLKDVILEIKDGGTPSRTKPEYFGGNVNWCVVKDILPEIHSTKETLTELGLSKCSAKVWPINSVIISLGATIGQIGIAKIPVATKQGISGIIVNEKLVKPELLVYYLNFKKEFIQKAATGATIKEIRPSKLAEILEFPLPPLPEQQRIVAILDEAFAAIAKAKANAEQNLKNAKELFESYLQGVFEKKGTGWEEKRFEELIQENQIGLIKSTKEQGNDKPYRYLKMDSITSDNNLIHDRYVYVDADKSELEKFTLNEGDFLFNTRNSYELVGKTCVFTPIDDEPTLFNNNIMRVVFKKDISSRFINYAFSSELVKERLQKLKSGTTSVVGIYYKGLRNLKIPVTKYKEQQTIVRQLDALRTETQKLEAVYQKKIDDLDELKKSILQKAFAGELKDSKIKA